MGSTMALIRHTLFVVSIGLFLQAHGMGLPAGGAILIAGSAATAYCGDEICQPEGCSFGGNETPGDGCLEDGGNCPQDCGYCGDGWCSPEIDEDIENCVYDCGYCGDGACVAYENYNNCSDDCGYCGDGLCQRVFEAAGSQYCESDCGPNDPYEDECTPTSDSGCSGGDMCNARGECVPPDDTCSSGASHGHCHNDTDCCSDQYCYIDCAAYPWMCWYGEPPQYHESGTCLPGLQAPRARQ